MKLAAKPLISVALAVFASFSFIVSASAAPIETPKTYVIVLPDNAAAGAPKVTAAGGRVLQTLRNVDALVVSIPAAAAARLAAANPSWIVEADQVFTVSGSQDVSSNSGLWGLDRIDQSSGLSGKYDYADSQQGQGVTAYVLDTGIRRDHSEFASSTGSRVVQGYQGYRDNSGTGDCGSHGTHVAGTIGGNTVGIAKKVSLVAVTILSCNGSGTTSVITAGADWVIGNHVNSTPAVANMSLGGGASSTLDAVVSKMVSDNITVVVAAGNSNADACTASPARAPEAITVAASTNLDARASFSNYGSCVDVFAPGEGVYSSVPTSTNTYATWDGTSMASPHVAGVAVRYLTANPLASPATVWAQLDADSTKGAISAEAGSPNKLIFADPSGYDSSGSSSATVPGQVTGLSIGTASSNSLPLSWNIPANGGSAITSYTVRYSTSSTFSTFSTASSTTNSLTLTGLNPSTTYWVQVAAENVMGAGAWSSSASKATTSLTAPGSPALTSVVALSRSIISVSWFQATGVVANYQLQMSTSSSFTTAQTWTLASSTLSAKVSNLKAGTRYYFRVRAVNTAGNSAWSNVLSAIALR